MNTYISLLHSTSQEEIKTRCLKSQIQVELRILITTISNIQYKI